MMSRSWCFQKNWTQFTQSFAEFVGLQDIERNLGIGMLNISLLLTGDIIPKRKQCTTWDRIKTRVPVHQTVEADRTYREVCWKMYNVLSPDPKVWSVFTTDKGMVDAQLAMDILGVHTDSLGMPACFLAMIVRRL